MENANESGGEEAVVIRYGELFLKSDPVKRQFTGALLRHLGRALSAEGISHTVKVHRGRILVFGDNPQRIAEIASRLFGVVDVAVCILTAPTADAVSRAAAAMSGNRLAPGMSFAVRARRQGVEGISSQELGALVGSAILDAVPSARVDLDEPEYEVFVELREYGGIVYDTRIPAPGGLPYGTQGKVLSLLSSGIDSPVAAWLLMKRGCVVENLHISAGPYAGNDVLRTTVRHHEILSTWCSGYPMALYVADAGEFYDSLTGSVEPRLRCILCKRFMMRVGSGLAAREGHLALCTGENLGQVASQTLTNMTVVSEAATVPVFRPLITYDKHEAVTLAKRIGTFEKSPGDLACRAVPKIPATASRLSAVTEAEERVSMDTLVKDALSGIRLITALDGKVLNP